MNILTAIKSADITNTGAIMVSDENIKKIQMRALETLDDIKSICDTYNIDYQLAAGSALGAIRHHGFIPWDDDIDINMCRKDFNKFITLFYNKFSDKYWIHTLGKTRGYTLLMTQINAKNVRARELMDTNHIECGLIVDIFIIENTFNNRLLRILHGVGCMGFRYILSCLRFKQNLNELKPLMKSNYELRKYARKRAILGNIFNIIPSSVWCKMALKWSTLCHNDESKYVFISGCESQFFNSIFVRQQLCESKEVMFEGRKVKISKDYDRYLKKLYGDYMKIPPIEKRHHHILMELDEEALNTYVKDRGVSYE